MTTLRREGNVFILDLGEGDHRFNPDALAELNAHLDEIEQASSPVALVTTASGKIWHNGLDLEYLAETGEWAQLLAAVEGLYARLLRLPLVTVAAVQGHAFAAGAMFSFAHDVRVMREDRGYLCLPEVDLGFSFTPGFAAIIAAKLSQPALHRMGVLGERLAGPAALQVGAVDAVAPRERVLAEAVSLAQLMASKAGPALATLRDDFYGETIRLLDHQTQSQN
jgi:enoyl-CoA hydratase/carnithine racemase